MSRFLSQGISLFLVPYYTRVFTPDDYGVIDLLNIFVTTVALVLPLQITQAVGRFYPDSDSPDQAILFSSSALLFTLTVFSGFLMLVQLFPAELSSQIFGDSSHVTLLRVVGVSLFCNGIFYFAQNQLNWMQKPAEHAIAALSCSLVTIGVTIICVLLLDFGVLGVFVGQVCGITVGFILSLYFGRESYRITFSRDLLFKMLRFSLPLVPAAFFLYCLAIISRLSIKQFLTLSDLGLFAIGFRISTVATMIMTGIMTAITPMIYSTYRDKSTPPSIEKAFRVTLLIALAATLSVSVFAREILIILTTPVYYSASQVVPYLLAAAFIAGYHVFSPGLRLQKETRIVAWIDFSAGIVSVILNIVLIQYLGIVGAAIASMLAAMFSFSVITWYSQKRYYIPYTWGRYLVAAGFTGFVVWIGFRIDLESLFASIGLKLLLILVALCAVCFLLTSGTERRGFISLARQSFGGWRRS